jgi:hypothetical protein
MHSYNLAVCSTYCNTSFQYRHLARELKRQTAIPKMHPTDHISTPVEYCVAPSTTSGALYQSVTIYKGREYEEACYIMLRNYVRMIPLVLYYRYLGSGTTSCRPWRSDHLLLCSPLSLEFSEGCPYIYVPPSTHYNNSIPAAYTFLHGITSFSRFRSSLGLVSALPLFRVVDLHCPCSPYGRRGHCQACGR